MQRLTAYFYTDDVQIVYTRVVRLQRENDVLAEIFDQVGLHKSVRRTVGML